MAEGAFFREDEAGRFVPTDYSRGFWSHDSIGGRSVVGLLGHVLERTHGAAGMMPARLNVDMHRMATFSPVHVETRMIRDGGRLRLAEAVMTIEGKEYARAQCQFLRTTEKPEGRVWAPEPWQVPPPDQLTAAPNPRGKRHSEWRIITGGVGVYGPRKLWMRDYLEVVEGRPLTAFDRVAVLADYVSPWTHASDIGVRYINTDVIVQIHRLPQGEWLGVEVTGHEASQGVAVGNCRIHDEAGAIGFVSTTALANVRQEDGAGKWG